MLKLEQGKTYQVKVLKVEKSIRRPHFQIKNDTFYNYILTVEVKIGKEWETGTLEHASHHMFEANLPFVVGVLQWVKCKKCSEMGCEIEAWDPEDNSQQARVEAARSLAEPGYKAPPSQARPQGETINLSGNSFIFALSYVKDLVVAEMESRPIGYIMEDADVVERVLRMGKQLNAGIVQFINEGK